MPFIKRIKGFTRELGRPADWQEDDPRSCQSLPIRDVYTSEGMFMVSAWELSPDEIKALVDGHSLKLWIRGTTHPVVALSVGELPESDTDILW